MDRNRFKVQTVIQMNSGQNQNGGDTPPPVFRQLDDEVQLNVPGLKNRNQVAPAPQTEEIRRVSIMGVTR